jgi:hypothetical protein
MSNEAAEAADCAAMSVQQAEIIIKATAVLGEAIRLEKLALKDFEYAVRSMSAARSDLNHKTRIRIERERELDREISSTTGKTPKP